MSETSDAAETRGKVLLSAHDENQRTVLEETLTIEDYYGESHPMIDDDDFRKQHSIRSVQGRIFDYNGKLDQEFNNEYGTNGAYIHSRIVHADGTVIED